MTWVIEGWKKKKKTRARKPHATVPLSLHITLDLSVIPKKGQNGERTRLLQPF